MTATAFQPADIYLPKKGTDLKKWSVIACDQYTSEPEYWNEVEKEVGNAPSTYNLILPECFLGKYDTQKRIKKINENMENILKSDIFDEYKNAYIYVERLQTDGIVRKGIVGKIDLEKYDFNKGSTSEVRATEKTVIERIPPRVKIREGAPLELPHIMILIDDPKNTVIEPVKKDDCNIIYDFDLMQGGGHLTGYLLNDSEKERVDSALSALSDAEAFEKKYSLPAGTPPLVFAMGDGNHSLATAKTFYENLKKANPGKDLSNHPARYALVEIVNLHSNALCFEAIHRLVQNTDKSDFIHKMKEYLNLSEDKKADQCFELVDGNKKTKYYINSPKSNITVGSIQDFLDKYLKENGGDCDYIHGSKNLETLCKKTGGLGILLPAMKKEELFPTVIKDGALPRKTFSMGHADDKRFYMEARKIR